MSNQETIPKMMRFAPQTMDSNPDYRLALFIREHLHNAEKYGAENLAPFIDEDENGDRWLYSYTDAKAFKSIDKLMQCIHWNEGENEGVQRSGTKFGAALLGTRRRYEMVWASKSDDKIIGAKLHGDDSHRYTVTAVKDCSQFDEMAEAAAIGFDWSVCYKVYLGSDAYKVDSSTIKQIQFSTPTLIND
jgi:hypothetical protein